MAYLPPQPWSTLTPTSTFPAAIINYSRTFGLIVEPISLIKRNLLCQTLNGEMRPTTTTNEYVIPVTQINDGQIGCPTRMTTPVLQIKDGQIQVRTKTYTNQDIHIKEDDVIAIINAQIIDTCKMDDMLQLYLTEGVLTDEKHRIGSIVANRQFQFDGPPPQAGAIYAGGWCITPEGDLALGDQDEFYQCLSGSFYNIYERSIAPQCSPIHLKVTNLVVC